MRRRLVWIQGGGRVIQFLLVLDGNTQTFPPLGRSTARGLVEISNPSFDFDSGYNDAVTVQGTQTIFQNERTVIEVTKESASTISIRRTFDLNAATAAIDVRLRLEQLSNIVSTNPVVYNRARMEIYFIQPEFESIATEELYMYGYEDVSTVKDVTVRLGNVP
jgi:hypothetical protein